MSKSTGNFLTLSDATDKFSADGMCDPACFLLQLVYFVQLVPVAVFKSTWKGSNDLQYSRHDKEVTTCSIGTSPQPDGHFEIFTFLELYWNFKCSVEQTSQPGGFCHHIDSMSRRLQAPRDLCFVGVFSGIKSIMHCFDTCCMYLRKKPCMVACYSSLTDWAVVFEAF